MLYTKGYKEILSRIKTHTTQWLTQTIEWHLCLR